MSDTPDLASDTPDLASDTPGLASDTPGFASDTPGFASDPPGCRRGTSGYMIIMALRVSLQAATSQSQRVDSSQRSYLAGAAAGGAARVHLRLAAALVHAR